MAKTIKKAQGGDKVKSSKDSVPSEMFPGKMIPKSKSNYETGKYKEMLQPSVKKDTTAKKPVIKKAQAGLKASSKRVGPVDPEGAWTKVQKRTIAGKKAGKVSLTKDKQLGATKMKKARKKKK